MKFLISLFLLAGVSAGAVEIQREFVEIRKGRSLYVNWVKAKKNQPTVVLVNGLTYSTRQWESFTEALIKKGLGVLRYDMYGMGETLLKYAPVLAQISYQDQVSDLHQLLEVLKLEKPYHIVGLSYGGGIAIAYGAAYPQTVENLVLMAPFTEKVREQDEWIKEQIAQNRRMFPFNPSSDEDLYDYFLRQLIYTTYPTVEPTAAENPFKLEAIFRMVQGIRKWNAKDDADELPAHKVHMIVADEDQYIKRRVLDDFWNHVPRSKKASHLVVKYCEHKIPEDRPKFSAAWVAEIVSGKRIQTGGQYEGDPKTGSIRGDSNFNIGRE